MATAAKPGTTNARPKAKDDKKDGKNKGPVFASDFGSHANMANAELTEKIGAAKQDQNDPWVILKDERGDFATRKTRIDTGLADPNRYADLPIRDKLVKELTAA